MFFVSLTEICIYNHPKKRGLNLKFDLDCVVRSTCIRTCHRRPVTPTLNSCVGGALAGETSYFGINDTPAFRQNNAFFAMLLLFSLTECRGCVAITSGIQEVPQLDLRTGFFVAFLRPSR
jgi:hypothetical protein